MKKIIFLLLFFFSTTVLGNSQKVINYFNNVQMETIEGIWMTSKGSSFYIIKEGIEYSAYMIDSPNYSSGAKWMNLYKNSETFFQGQCTLHNYDKGTVTLRINGSNNLEATCKVGWSSQTISINRTWPNNIDDHNRQVEARKRQQEREMAAIRQQQQDSMKLQTKTNNQANKINSHSSNSNFKDILKKITGH
jgi:hypothetical protein